MEFEDWQVLVGVATNNTTNFRYKNFVKITIGFVEIEKLIH